jgi:hypothetical protein
MRRALLCCIGIAVFACGPTGPAASNASPTAASPSLSPNPPVEVLSVVGTNSGTTIHVLTIAQGSATDRPVVSNQPLRVIDANQRIALITTKNSTQLATLDLQTGVIRELGVTSPGDVGPGVMSPDGASAAVEVRHADLISYEIVIVDLGSGAVRHLLQVPASAYNRAGLVPWRWTSSGILVSPGVLDPPRYKLLNLDPQSGTVTPITDAQVDVLSPDATMLAAAGHANLGDMPFQGQGLWPNRLTAGPVGAPPAVIAQQKNRAFHAFDIVNDGSILYVADDAPFNASGLASNDAPPAPDMGIYVESGGQSAQQLGETRVGQWVGGSFVGPGQVLVAKQLGGSAGPTGAEIDLVGFCLAAGCTATTEPVQTVSGANAESYLMQLRP